MTSGLVTTDIARAVECLRSGGLAAIPTETVYGLAADADNPEAVRRIFEVKGRPVDHPLIVHVASGEEVAQWVSAMPSAAATLADTCWPGPLTLLLARGARVSDLITGGRPTVGLRVPAHPVAHVVLEAFGGGLAAPSANRFGRVSPTTAEHVVADLGVFLDPTRDVVLDGGASPVGVESTIVDCTVVPPQVLRPGAITAEQIADLLGEAPAGASGPSRAAGMLASHYAPSAIVHLADSAAAGEALVTELRAAGRDAAVLDGTTDLAGYARTLYASLRDADRQGRTDVVAVLPPAAGLGHAIRDRLTKAATRAPGA